MGCKLEGKRVLVIGIGGGGDVAAAYCVAKWVEDLGGDSILASIIWERLVRDPLPGPISPEELKGVERLSDHLWLADGDEFAVRGGKKVIPQATKLSKASGRKVLLLDLTKGSEGVKKGIEDAIKLYDVDLVIAVDAGGDVLAKKDDEEVWSPLADSVCLASLKGVKDVERWLAVYGPGCDGELPSEKVLERIAEVWRRSGNEGGFVISKDYAEECLRIVNSMDTEASKMGLLAALGYYGEHSIRRGSRRLFLSPVMATVFFLDIEKIESELVEAVIGTNSIEEANERLMRIGVYTELELEKDIIAAGGWERADLEEIKRKGRERVKSLSEF